MSLESSFSPVQEFIGNIETVFLTTLSSHWAIDQSRESSQNDSYFKCGEVSSVWRSYSSYIPPSTFTVDLFLVIALAIVVDTPSEHGYHGD